MRSVQIYVENRILDLFNDEQIVINSTVQNISDIGKVFTDFSQTFTIPCTKQNNYIFEHYYNNDVDNVVDHNRRRLARIEIDHIAFKTGKVQLEKSEIKSGNAESYTVTFYGDIVTIKDLIGDAKLSDLDYLALDHTYSGTEIQARVETDFNTTDYDVRYPLISSGRVWQYGSADANDISLNTAPIDFTELFPAVRVRSIFDEIATKYSITFTGSFLDSKRFRHLFMWYKNKEALTFYTKGKSLAFGESGASTDPLYNGIVQYSFVNPSSLVYAPYTICSGATVRHQTTIEIVTPSNIDYYLDVYDDGEFLFSRFGNGTTLFPILNEVQSNISTLQRSLTFKLRSAASMSFTCTANYELFYTLIDLSLGGSVLQTSDFFTDGSNTSISTLGVTDLSFYAPDMKIIDFINSIVNVYNFTVVSENQTTFRIEPLDTYYNNGIDWNITEFTDFNSIQIDRPKLYNNINFKWQPSGSFMNREFLDLFRKEYGDLSSNFGYDGGDYTIQLPFETPLHQKFTDTGLQVGYCLGTEPEYKNYVPKPTLLYMYDYEDVNVSFYFDDGTTSNEITGYMPFGQDMIEAQDNYTLNWGSEISSFTLNVVNNSLYRTYYESYLLNLYDPKTRIVTVKCNLPINELVNIQLNDSLIIRDKKYLINDMKSNLVTGEVNLVLLSNWRDAHDYSGVYKIKCAAQTLNVSFSIPDAVTVTIGTPLQTQFATPSDTTPTGEQTVSFSCTANGTGVQRTNTFPLTITVRGVVTPTQYLTIIQDRCYNNRRIEGVGFTIRRIIENRQNRASE